MNACSVQIDIALFFSISAIGVQTLSEKLVVIPGDDKLSKEAQFNSTLLFNMLLRSVLASNKVIYTHRLSHEAFDWVIGEVESRFQHAMVRFSALHVHWVYPPFAHCWP